MISVSERSPVAVWKRAFSLLYKKGSPVPENGFYRNECAALEVCDTSRNSAWHTPMCPTSAQEIAAISHYFVHGGDQTGIDHEWTKIYRYRIFEEQKRIDKIVALLMEWPDCPRAQISLWNSEYDYVRSNVAPCLQILWFKIIDCRLDLHVQMRTTDCYGKLLMNMNEFLELQHHVAGKLALPTGVYCQFVDSLHFHTKDASVVDRLAGTIESDLSQQIGKLNPSQLHQLGQ
jgi:thymidylate synthase